MIQEQQIPLVRFSKGVRKDDVMKERLRQFKAEEGVVFVGVAQEKCAVPRTVRKTFANGANVPWLVMSTAMVNVYYFYCKDRDFGPFFIKFCSYFPYGIKLCLNGHEYLKQQLAQRGVAFEALDNGLLGCADLALAQKICANLNAEKIDRMFRKWLRRLPHPYSTKTRRAGYRYQLSIWQAEFSLTQVWDKPAHGREFFEQVIRENIDLGRPENVQLIFRKKCTNPPCAGELAARGSSPKAWNPRCISIIEKPTSSNITKRGGRCAPKPPSMTPTTSRWGASSTTSMPCARLVLAPIDDC
jgi:hypothetical protein